MEKRYAGLKEQIEKVNKLTEKLDNALDELQNILTNNTPDNEYYNSEIDRVVNKIEYAKDVSWRAIDLALDYAKEYVEEE